MSLPGWTWYGNSFDTLVIAVILAVVLLAALLIAKLLVARSLRAFAKGREDTLFHQIAQIIRSIHLLSLLVFSIYLSSQILTLPAPWPKLIQKTTVMVALIQTGLLGDRLASLLVHRFLSQSTTGDEARVAAMTAFGFMSKLFLWVALLLLALANLGVNVSALVAGLGIGGIAVALALQNLLGDLFGSFSIVMDKPFVIGDFIVVDQFSGTVEHIGLKSTRIRSLSGEQLVFANSDLLKSRIRNYRRMSERRVVFQIRVTYQTVYDKLVKIPGMVKEIIESQDLARFDRAHLKELGPSSLKYEVVYWILDIDYNLYMDIQQAVNLAIFKRFEAEGIQFAYPTMHLEHSPLHLTDGLSPQK